MCNNKAKVYIQKNKQIFKNTLNLVLKMLTKEQIDELRKELEDCHRPLIFFHDDADGLSSFLLFYRFIKDGKGIVLKAPPELGEEFAKKVEEYQPDKVFILDKPKVSQEFLDNVKCKVIWIDHHMPVSRYKVKYYNIRIAAL